MIGVIASSSESTVVREFFELFKTPWEFYRSGRRYEVLLCCGDVEVPEGNARLVLFYAGRQTSFDRGRNIRFASHSIEPRLLFLNGARIAIYGENLTFGDDNSGSAKFRTDGKTVARIGYDLFAEIRILLTAGQPAENAGIPALDLHISALRQLIVASGIRLVEIPPVPDGCRFVACLTHDLDHPSIRLHRFDHTMFGFLYRATLGSVMQFLRRRLPLRGLWKNWAAALKLPLVHLGLAKDFWEEFDGYRELGEGAAATYFVIPFPNRAGQGAPGSRAAAYGAASLSSKLQALHAAGCEIGLHGIDAWNSASQASAESEEIRRITGERETGVRMHWLYYSDDSPGHLEKAGMVYDSTVGYNQTVGFRAGTAQVYKPLETMRLLEIPLHIMDTALFYPGYLNLSPEQAWKRVGTIIRNAVELGGCVTVNWHDRSIAPERQWDQFYRKFIEEMRIQGARFCTAAQTAAWFRMRRSVVFENVAWEQDRVRARIAADCCAVLPGLQLRVHLAENSCLDVPIDRESAGGGNPGDRCSFTLDVPLGRVLSRHTREAGDTLSVPCTRVN